MPDLTIALISALFTVLIAYGTYLLNQRHAQRKDAQFLVDDLAHRRAFVGEPSDDIEDDYIEGAVHHDDYHRVNTSILAVRDEIRLVRSRAGTDPQAQRVLSEMTRACNQYLEISDRNPNSYVIELFRLRTKLTDGISTLASLRHIEDVDPGSRALFEDTGIQS